MKKLLLTFIILATASFAQTRNLVPKASGEGSIGDTNSQWEALYVGSLFLNGQSIENYLPTNAGVTSINGLLGDVGFTAGRGFMSSNDGSKVYLNLFTNTFVVGTNIATYRFTGGEQYFQVPNNVTNMKAWLWGGAGAGIASGGAGGYSDVDFKVLPEEILTVVVGQGGRVVTGTAAVVGNTGRTYPDGGEGISRGTITGSGGGRSQILRGSLSITNLERTVAIAAGGGGGNSVAGGAGGGDSGGAGTGTTGGGAATYQYGVSSIITNIYTNDAVVTTNFEYNILVTNVIGGSSLVTTGFNMMWTNTAGGLLYGGSGGISTNSTNGRAAGGGGGWYGGGGAAATAVNNTASGGGGMGWISTNMAVRGRTIRGVGATPAGTEFPYWISGAGVGQLNGSPLPSEISANYVSGHGLVILQY